MNAYHRNLSSLCRACLTDEMVVKHNLNENAILMDLLLSLVKSSNSAEAPATENELPQFLCGDCCTKLRDLSEFRGMICRSQRILGDMLQLAREVDANKRRSLSTPDAAQCVNYEWLEYQETSALGFVVDDECDEEEDADSMQSVNFSVSSDFVIEDVIVEAAEADNESETEQYPAWNQHMHIATIARETADMEDDVGKGNEVSCDAAIRMECVEEKRKKLSSKQMEVKVSGKRGEVKFFCAECPHRWFLTQENLAAHMRTHQGLRPFACTQCERSFNLSSQLRVHVREDHSAAPRRFECPYEDCEKWFTKSGSLKTHVRYKHARYTPYMCEYCGRVFSNSFVFREHRYQHTSVENYPFQCEQCGMRFAAKSRYIRHLVRHSGIKSFECPHCNMKKYTRDELNAHLNTHTKAKLWSCHFCSKTFTTSTNCRIHEQTVHKGIRKFNCHYCHLTFGRLHTRKRHELTHTGERPFACDLCDKRFIQSVTLATHLRTHSKGSAKETKAKTKGLQLPNVGCSPCGGFLHVSDVVEK